MRTLSLVIGATLLATAHLAGAQAVDASSRFASASTAGGPPTLSPAGEGRRRFLALNCYGCHGMFAGGGMAPSIVGAEKADVSEAMLQGEDTGMPSFMAYVTSTDINYVAAYLASIGTVNEPTFMDWWVKIPPK